MKHPENLHRDYDPHNVVTHYKSDVLGGVIILLCFFKKRNLTTFEKILKFFYIVTVKDIYFWLPYKSVVSGSDKYGVIGPKSRSPYAMQWFEIKETHRLYKQGLYEYDKLEQLKDRIRTSLPFQKEDLYILTRKVVIRMLDEFVFNKQQQKK